MTYRGGKLTTTPTIQWTNMDESEIYLLTLLRKKSRNEQIAVQRRFKSLPAQMMVSHSDSVVYTTVGHNRSVDSEGYKNRHIYKADENGLFFRLPPNKTLTLKGDFLQWCIEFQAYNSSLSCCVD
jgi:hypothetical protein